MVSEVNNSGLTLASLKSRLEGFSQTPAAPVSPTPNAQQSNGVISARQQDTVEPAHPNFEILAFAKTAKGANEYIGALQTASSTLKKIDKAISEGASDEQVRELAANSKFLGNTLFDKNLIVSIGKNDFSLTLQNPASLPAEQRGEYIAATRDAISKTLGKVSEAITSPEATPNVPINGQEYNFEEFDAEAFKRMF
ncbi:MAG: flagellar FLiS export co-chaperone [Helicobacter sp.]|nr:flagellar FLiS export co-chaperone [Helicobacter sp.]